MKALDNIETEVESTEKTAVGTEVSTNRIIEDVEKINKDLKDAVRTMKIDDKTAREWHKIYEVILPKEASPQQVRDAVSKASNNIQNISVQITEARVKLNAVQTALQEEQGLVMAQIVKEYKDKKKAIPQNAVLTRLISPSLNKWHGHIMATETSLQLWEDCLRKNRDILNAVIQLNIANAHELKLQR